jgi:hypothetical protein
MADSPPDNFEHRDAHSHETDPYDGDIARLIAAELLELKR